MSAAANFLNRLETKVTQQLSSQRVGYLLGAGASYLGGNGYPLAGKLWDCIGPKLPKTERDEIQAKLDGGADGIDNALDLLDDGFAIEKPHRHLVTEAIATHFHSISPPTDVHQVFVRRLAARDELSTPVFCLNYDGLIELAADAERIRVVDGFTGQERPFFDQTDEGWREGHHGVHEHKSRTLPLPRRGKTLLARPSCRSRARAGTLRGIL